MKRRALIVGAVCAWCVPSGSARSQEGEGGADQADPRRPRPPAIALCVPRTGPLAAVGAQLEEVARFALAQMVDAERKPIALRVIDEAQPEPALARALAEIERDDRVIAAIGPLQPSRARFVIALTRRSSLPLLLLAPDAMLDARSGRRVSRGRHTPEEVGAAMGRAAIKEVEGRRAAVFFPETPYGRASSLGFSRSYVSQGGRITSAVGYAPEALARDPRPFLRALVGQRAVVGHPRPGLSGVDRYGTITTKGRRAIDFDALFIPDFHPVIAKLLPFLPTVGIASGEGGDGEAVQLFGVPGWQGASMRQSGAHAAGAIYHDPFVGESAGAKEADFERAFEEELGRRPVDLEAEAFDLVSGAAGVVRDLFYLKKAQDIARYRERFVARLPSARAPWYGVCGPLSFGPRGAPERPFSLYRFDVDGEVVPLD